MSTSSHGLFDEDIGALRERLYEETKHLTRAEFIEHVNETAEKMFRECGVRPRFVTKKKQRVVV
jgi:hypothetical protein